MWTDENLKDYPFYQQRKTIQNLLISEKKSGGGFEQMSFLHWLLVSGLKIFGLEKRGFDNILDIQLLQQKIHTPNLPKEYEGLRILHLSDTHLDGLPGLLENILKIIEPLEYDLCIITGDFRYAKREYDPETMNPSIELIKNIKAPKGIFGVLGNHDVIEQVPVLEQAGVRILMNEAVPLDDTGQFYIAGVDDPHIYKTNNLEDALENVPDDVFKLLLVHSPEIIDEASKAGCDLYFCGHTHGGQIQFPLLGMLLTNARCARKFAAGNFSMGNMQGHTHVGTGASCVPVRFLNPSAIVVHTLTRE